MPVRGATTAQQSHRQRRGTYHANTFFFQIVQIFRQQIVVQTVVTEAQYALHRTFIHTVDDPLEVLRLQVCQADMTNYSLFLQLQKGRQRLVNNLLQAALHRCLELYVVHIDQVDVANA